MIRTIIKYKDNKILLDENDVFEISNKLFPGFYDIEFNEYNRFKNFIQLNIPKVYPLMPSTELNNIQDYIKIFLSEDYENLCKITNILRKSGILLYGKPGIGKSNYFNYIIDEAIKQNNACVFNINSELKLRTIGDKLRELRLIQKELFIVVLEEMDELFNNSSCEAVIKNLMDGVDSVENTLFLASTNYIDKIPKTLTDRPSRFKKVLEIKQSDNIEEVKKWLELIYKLFIPTIESQEIENLHELCINKSIDEIKNNLIDYKSGIIKINSSIHRSIGFKK